jgi:hypothetical protein
MSVFLIRKWCDIFKCQKKKKKLEFCFSLELLIYICVFVNLN